MNFKIFSSILIGMCFIGISLGYVLGFYFNSMFESHYLAYIGALFLGIGSGLVLMGVLFNKHFEP